MSYETIKVDRDGQLLTITLNRPERLNAMPPAMADEIGQVFYDLGDARAVLITGEGKGFCSGADLSARGSDSALTGKGFDQLDLCPIHARIGRRIDETDLNSLLAHVEGLLDIYRTHRVTIMRDRLCDRGRCYADVIETSQFHDSTTTSVLIELAMKQALCDL